MLTPPPACRTTLLRKSTFRIVHHVQLPPELRTVSTIAQPACACTQLFSKTFCSMTMSCAFFSSNRFLTVHLVPPGATVPAVPAAPVSVKVACVTVQ